MRILVSILFSVALMATPSVAQDKADDDRMRANVKKLFTEDMSDTIPSNLSEAISRYKAAAKMQSSHLQTFYAEYLYLFVEKELSLDETAKMALLWLERYNIYSGDHNSPEKPFLKTLSKLEKDKNRNHAVLSTMYLAIGDFYAARVKMSKGIARDYNSGKATKFYVKLIKLTKKYTPQDELKLAIINIEIGKGYYHSGDGYEALKHFVNGQKFFTPRAEEYPEQLADAEFWIAKVHLGRGQYKKAEFTMTKALNILEKTNSNSQLALSGHAFMVQILENRGRREEATKHAQIIGALRPFDPDQEQIPLYRTAPTYPLNAANLGLEGWVMVEYTIDEQGFPKNPKAIDGENLKSFEKAAIAAVKKFRFAPRFEDGKPVSTDNLTIILRFKTVW